MDKLNVESIAKAVVENAVEIIKKTTPLVAKFVRISFECLLEIAAPLISTAKNWIQTAPLSYTIVIGFVLILLLLPRCGGGGGTGKTMKAPGRNNVRILRSSFERSPKSYFRSLRPKKA
ncbi:hypothetical protein HAX54_024620 [Datura stramonium]|uniref:Uncharacterized protein n=1 Tax=Datura stramonium TaxID=4076 RepID=A0ABS8RH30_DATST|nr:hypothetical protein [Datura stramonium]